jgi:hypothetical protein
MRISKEDAPAVETAPADEKHVTINQDDQTGEEKKKWSWAATPSFVLKRHLLSQSSSWARRTYEAILVKANYFTGFAEFESWNELAELAGIARGHVVRGVTELIAKYMITKGARNTFKLVRTETEANDLVRERPATIHQAKLERFKKSRRCAGAHLSQVRRRAPSSGAQARASSGAQARASSGAQARAPGNPHTLKHLDHLLDQQQMKSECRTNVRVVEIPAAAADEGVEIGKTLREAKVNLKPEEFALIRDLDYLRMLIANADQLDHKKKLEYGKGRYIASGLKAAAKGLPYEPLPGVSRLNNQRLNDDQVKKIDADRKVEARKEAKERAEREKLVRAWLDERDNATLARLRDELLERRSPEYGDVYRGADPRKRFGLASDLYREFAGESGAGEKSADASGACPSPASTAGLPRSHQSRSGPQTAPQGLADLLREVATS